MVHRMDSDQDFPSSSKSCRKKSKLKTDFGDDKFKFLAKRPKFDFSNQVIQLFFFLSLIYWNLLYEFEIEFCELHWIE